MEWQELLEIEARLSDAVASEDDDNGYITNHAADVKALIAEVRRQKEYEDDAGWIYLPISEIQKLQRQRNADMSALVNRLNADRPTAKEE